MVQMRRSERPAHHVEMSHVLRLLVMQRGVEVACDGEDSIRCIDDTFFEMTGPDRQVSEPFTGLEELFASRGFIRYTSPGGRILGWRDWTLSVDHDGCLAGPYETFDEWVWAEAETVTRDEAHWQVRLGTGARYIHHWNGLYFLSVDPLPTVPVAFTSLESAQQHSSRIPAVARGARPG